MAFHAFAESFERTTATDKIRKPFDRIKSVNPSAPLLLPGQVQSMFKSRII